MGTIILVGILFAFVYIGIRGVEEFFGSSKK